MARVFRPLIIILTTCGCLTTGENSRYRRELDDLQARQTHARARLAIVEKQIAEAEDRAHAAKVKADFEACRARSSGFRATVAIRQAQCLETVSQFELCRALNEKSTANKMTAGCGLGILAAIITGGAAIPLGIGGCAAGGMVGVATEKNCPFKSCEVNAEKLSVTVLAEQGLAEWPQCGGYVGMEVTPLLATAASGLRIAAIGPGTTAQYLGLAAGDVLLRIGGTDMTSDAAVDTALQALKVGDTITVEIIRDRRRIVTTGATRSIDAWGKPTTSVRLGIAYGSPAIVTSVQYAEGFMIRSVDPQGPAAAAGIRAGDYIISINAKAVPHEPSLRDALDVGPQENLEFVLARLTAATQLKVAVRLAPRAGRKGY
jgi:membrane-associated protease RseP (regulator of RpoE activity)